ncbi:MAG: hypothetical protein NUV81_00345 [bacterium]|nr:hypothetical protein [bacterium]
MEDIKEVYYFPIDAVGNEVEDPIRIGLNEDGSADLSGLPEAMRVTLERVGASTPLTRATPTLPKDGKHFLGLLLRQENPYQRFRQSPIKKS